MKKSNSKPGMIKRTMVIGLTVALLGISGAAYADATSKTPADIVSALTGKTVTALNEERAAGKTYGTLAKEAGKLEAFQQEMLVQKKAILDQRVKAGSLTQAQADQIYAAIKANMANCDGTGNAKIGSKNGVGFGQGMMGGKGNGAGMGRGHGMGAGNGFGNGNCGNCTVQ